MIGAALQAAQAQSTRTYVSRTGKDGNTCTEASPCRTLQAALAKTQAGGQIYTLGSADYGYVTINKAVSIISGRGATGVLATSNVSGITINAGANDIINLQGLNIDGAGVGSNGILFTSGAALNVKDSVVRGFSTAINFQPSGASTLSVTSTLLTNNATGVSFLSAAASTGTLADVQLINGSIGLVAQGASSSGQAVVTLQNCVVANNTTVGIRAAGYSAVTAGNCTIANNGIGLEAQSATALLQVSGSTVTGNGIGWQVSNGGQVISASNNTIGGNTSGNAAPPTTPGSPTPEDPPPPEPNVVAKNIVTDFGATCDGVADDAPAFAAFNAWSIQNQGNLTIELTIPSGTNCTFLSHGPSAAGVNWAKGIKRLLVLGYGATLSSPNDSKGIFFNLGGQGICHRGLDHVSGCSARTDSVTAGETSAKLKNPVLVSRFRVGGYAIMTGYDLQGLWNAPYGFPPNFHFFDYVKITAIDAGTGTVSFDRPLRNDYKETWPNYNSGSGFEADSGGPATLYALDPTWDTSVEYRGLTIVQNNQQTLARGRNVTFKDVSFAGSACAVPSENEEWKIINSDFSSCQIEVDKLNDVIVFSASTVGRIDFQSSSNNNLIIDGSTINSLIGTPKHAAISNSQLNIFRPGAWAYGRTDEVNCTECIISQLQVGGLVETANGMGANVAYSMQNGIITVPNSLGAVRWAVPGTRLMWTSAQETETSFRVVDVWQDATNTYVQTNLSGGFPEVARHSSGALNLRTHPAPKFTCKNCTGSVAAIDLANAPAGVPLFSYSKRTYTGGNLANLAQVTLWGKLKTINVTVGHAYSGSQTTLAMNLFGQFKANATDAPNYSATTNWNPVVNLRVAGSRTILPSAVSGTQSGDSLNSPGALWFGGTQRPFVNNGILSEEPSLLPTVTVEVTTDQELEIP